MNISGLHHVTAIASDPQRNLDFYAGTLGLRLVKRTINFDDPGSYHFYFGDAVGTPGTILTFFPWPNARHGVRGTGEVTTTAYSVPVDSIPYWADRLQGLGLKVERPASRFGEEVLRFSDPDGMAVELIGSATSAHIQTWTDGPVPVEHALRGFHSVSATLDDTADTARLLTEVFGYRLAGESGNRLRFTAQGEPTLGQSMDLVQVDGANPGRLGAGSVHHIAFRATDDDAQQAWREKISHQGFGVSPIMDRSYFHSIYFREPGGVLFEIATDGPGFATDESVADLGRNLRLPSWMESSRSRIEEILPKITLPSEVLS